MKSNHCMHRSCGVALVLNSSRAGGSPVMLVVYGIGLSRLKFLCLEGGRNGTE